MIFSRRGHRGHRGEKGNEETEKRRREKENYKLQITNYKQITIPK
jgi:hypothetical protein